MDNLYKIYEYATQLDEGLITHAEFRAKITAMLMLLDDHETKALAWRLIAIEFELHRDKKED